MPLSPERKVSFIISFARQLSKAIRESCRVGGSGPLATGPYHIPAARRDIGLADSELRFSLTYDPRDGVNVEHPTDRRRMLFSVYRWAPYRVLLLKLDALYFERIQVDVLESQELPEYSEEELAEFEQVTEALAREYEFDSKDNGDVNDQSQEGKRQSGRPPSEEVRERRELVLALHQEGMKHGDIASKLGISVDTVKKDIERRKS